MKKNFIDIKNIGFAYKNEGLLFKNLSMTIKEGETVGLIGSNGAGKSTLLKVLVGLNSVVDGVVEIDGIEVNKTNLKDIRKIIGFAFQDSDNQLFMTTVREDVEFGPRNQGLEGSELEETVNKALEEVGVSHLSDRPPYKLSGGEKRLVAIATVLAMQPSMLILDEPTTGLDPKARRNLIDIIKNLKQTKVIATHDMDMALDICDRVIVLYNGSAVLDGKPVDIFRDIELLNKYHLEQPLSMQGCHECRYNIGG